MIDDKEMMDVMQSIADKSFQLTQDFYLKPENPSVLINQFIELTKEYQTFIQQLLANPEKLFTMQVDYWQQSLQLMNETMTQWLAGKPLESKDKRFSHEDWHKNPFFNLLSHQYLLATQHIQQLLDSVEHEDEASAKKIRFFTEQYLNALSPSNFLATNPVVLNETIESGGKNVLKGLDNLLSDLKLGKASLDIQMSCKETFKIGENLATTPGKVVYQNDLMQLIQYSPSTEKVHKIPLLIIPPWINKYYILDLSEKNSFVRFIVEQGFTVFMISWVNPSSELRHKGLEDYLNEGSLTAIEQIKKQTKSNKVNTLGFCIGGTLLACTLAYLQAKDQDFINTATFLTTLIDFSDPGDISVFVDEKQIETLEKEMAEKGYLSGKHMASTFNSLRANDLIWSFFVNNYLHGKKPIPFDILYWNADSTNMPEKMHSQYLRKMYLNNELIQANKIELNNTKLDVSQIKTPSYFVSTINDHIAPWKTTYNGFAKFSGEKTFLLGGSGHIAGIVNPPSKKKYGYHVHDFITHDPDKWLEGATFHEGSWWPEWVKWLKKKSGPQVKSRYPESGMLAIIEDAPGSYVKMKTPTD